MRAAAQHRAGLPELARQTLAEVEQLAEQNLRPGFLLGLAHLSLGDRDQAVRRLQLAYDRRDGYMVY